MRKVNQKNEFKFFEEIKEIVIAGKGLKSELCTRIN